jgi:hypothetical protein
MQKQTKRNQDQYKAWQSTCEPNARGYWLEPKALHQKLVRSLACYITPEDAILNRGNFLRIVMSRIEDDLHYDSV